jgi:hypothetical protein
MDLTLPHQFQPRAYQLPLLRALDSGCKRAVIVWHRRSGKDKTCFNYMIKRAASKVGTYYYLLPSFTQAKRVIWDNIDNDGFKMLEHIPKALIRSTNASELKVELFNGSIIQLMAADEFKHSGVGTNPIGVVFSEYSLCDPEAWNYLRPILAANGGWVIFNYTPRGKNHAWELLERAKQNTGWFWEILTVDNTDVLDAATLAEEKRDAPQAIFEQEYYCKFIEGAGQFFRRIRENTYVPHDQTEAGDFQLGVDLAKYQDWTVLTPFNLNTFTAYPQDRFQQVDWNLQKARIEAAALRYSNARVKIDGTGLGDPIAEDLRARGLNMTEEDIVKFTEATRTNLLTHLSMLLEQDLIKIPDDPGLISELEAFQWRLVTNKQTGKARLTIAVPEGMHDDRVMSLALAVHGAKTPIPLDIERGNPRFAERENTFNLYNVTYD